MPPPATPRQADPRHLREEIKPKARRLVLVVADLIDTKTMLPTPREEDRLTRVIGRKYPQWWHWLHGTWILATDETVEQVAEFVVPLLEERPVIVVLVAEAGRPMTAKGWLPKEAWTWLKEHMPPEKA
jgi:hypothetical protein